MRQRHTTLSTNHEREKNNQSKMALLFHNIKAWSSNIGNALHWACVSKKHFSTKSHVDEERLLKTLLWGTCPHETM